MALVIGVVLTLAASLEPAWRAGRIPPVEALRRGPPALPRARPGCAGWSWSSASWPWRRWPSGRAVPAAAPAWAPSPRGGGSGAWGPLVIYGLLLLAVLLVPRLLGSAGPSGRAAVPHLPQRGAAGPQLAVARPQPDRADRRRPRRRRGHGGRPGDGGPGCPQDRVELADRDDPRQRAADLDSAALHDRPDPGTAGRDARREVRLAHRTLRRAVRLHVAERRPDREVGRAPGGGRDLRTRLPRRRPAELRRRAIGPRPSARSTRAAR